MRAKCLAMCLVLWAAGIASAAEEGLVGFWDFEEGAGDAVADRSGQGNTGVIHGAKFVRLKNGYALKFNGIDNYVDCGAGPSLDLRGPLTLSGWVYVDASSPAEPGVFGKFFESYAVTLYKGSVYSYISGGSNGVSSVIPSGVWQHVAGTFDGDTLRLHLNGVVAASGASKFKETNPGRNFLMGCIIGNPDAEDVNYQTTAFFGGMLDDVRVYNRALSLDEIQAQFRAGAEEHGIAPEWFDRMHLRPFYYFHEQQITLETDLRAFMPFPEKGTVEAQLILANRTAPVAVARRDVTPDTKLFDLPISLAGAPRGHYELRVTFTVEGRDPSHAVIPFDYPLPPLVAPSPSVERVGALPSAPRRASFELRLSPDGGFVLESGGERWLFESTFTWPRAGVNVLSAGIGPKDRCERGWKVSVRKAAPNRYVVYGRGAHYAVERELLVRRTHVLVRDRIVNLTDDDLGVVMHHFCAASPERFPASWLGGMRSVGRAPSLHNPTVFVGGVRSGMGVVALDDVTVIQGKVFREGDRAGLADEIFGLGPRAAYTVEWAAYPMAAPDYFDFLNTLRDDLGLNGQTLIGGCVTHSEFTAPPEEKVRRLGARVALLGNMARVPDDPGLSVEGVEFMNFPKLMDALRATFEATRAKYPGMRCCFHIAHSLYTTNTPDRFSDAKVIGKDGRQAVWSRDRSYLLNYFSAENLDAGWDWHIFYPTLANSFFPEMMKAVDVLRDTVLADGIYADGLFMGYGSPFTYDRWDGHSVEIDPNDYTVTRKFGCVQLMAHDALLAYTNAIAAKGGLVLVDSGPATITYARKAQAAAYPIESGSEQGTGATHITPFPMAFGFPLTRDHLSVYRDVLGKLRHGLLYYYYYGNVDHDFLLTHMYPITIERVYAGCVIGRERIVTMNSGIYGWAGDRRLHRVHLTDGRGVLVPSRFLTTVDGDSARTRLVFAKDESAVVERLPVTLTTRRPVNVIVQRYDASGITLVCNGEGDVTFTLERGEFEIAPEAYYSFVVNDLQEMIRADTQGRASRTLTLRGPTTIRIAPLAY